MSGFSSVDEAADPGRLVAILDEAAVGLAAMKAYMAMTHRLRSPRAPVLNVGCGAGHDLAALAAVGVAGVGVDPRGRERPASRSHGMKPNRHCGRSK